MTADPQEQIRSLLEAIAEKEKQIEQKKSAMGSWTMFEQETVENSEKADEMLALAQEEWRACEREKVDIAAQYEACQRNRALHSQAEEFRKEIVDTESELRLADEKISALEKQLHQVSARYKNERERRVLMINKVRSMMEELSQSVQRKIQLTVKPEIQNINAPACLKILTEISRERESECRQWSKYCHEVAAIVDLKRDRARELQLESRASIAKLNDMRNQEMQELIQKCENERQAIIAEINELKAMHQQQLEQLRSVKVTTDRGGKLAAVPRSKPSGVTAEKFLSDKLKDHDVERESLEETLRQVTAERHRVAVATRQLQQEIESDTQKHHRAMHNLQSAISNEKQDIIALEKENRQLRDLCDSLSSTLRSGFIPQ